MASGIGTLGIGSGADNSIGHWHGRYLVIRRLASGSRLCGMKTTGETEGLLLKLWLKTVFVIIDMIVVDGKEEQRLGMRPSWCRLLLSRTSGLAREALDSVCPCAVLLAVGVAVGCVWFRFLSWMGDSKRRL